LEPLEESDDGFEESEVFDDSVVLAVLSEAEDLDESLALLSADLVSRLSVR
jgi:hypothetical protein